MKNLLLASAVAAALSYVPASQAATSADDLAQIRQQLQSLMERVDKLEHENTELKSENDQLKTQGDYLKAETRGLRKDAANASVDAAKVKGTDWASKVTFKGDVRYRHEEISDDSLSNVQGVGLRQTADRYRDRIRARLSLEAQVTDSLLAGIGFTTTEGSDPRSGNQSLTGVFSKKALDLDLAYIDWKFASWGDVIFGKMKQPFFKPGQSFFWENDITPEGVAINLNSGIWFGTAYGYWVNEVSGTENTVTADTQLFGGQVGVKLPIGASNLVLAAHYYDLASGQGRAPFYNGNANGNTTVTVNTVAVLLNDYQVAELAVEWNANLGALPLQVWADFAQNQDADEFDTAWGAGVLFGKASNYRTWEAGVSYYEHQKDALFAQLVDSDFAGGTTDADGWVVRAAFAPQKNWTLNLTYFLSQRNMDVVNGAGQTDVDYKRVQVDFNAKF